MTKKVIYFIAGNVPTGPEQTAIDKLVGSADSHITPAYEVVIRSNVNGNTPNYGENRFEAADYVAGTLPGGAAGEFYDEIDVINPDAIPAQGLLATEAVVRHNVDMTLPVTGTYATKIKATVVAGVITGFVVS